MRIEPNSALLVIDIQKEDFMGLNEDNINNPEWDCIRNAKRVLDIFRANNLPVIQIKEVHRPDMVDFGRELDGSEGIHCLPPQIWKQQKPYDTIFPLKYGNRIKPDIQLSCFAWYYILKSCGGTVHEN